MSKGNDEWLEWATYNLAAGIPDADVRGEMIKNGFSPDEVASFVSELVRSPQYRAARQLSRKYKLACDLNEALLEMAAQAFDFTEIERVSGLSSDEFHFKYYTTNRPIIIEDVVPNWPAIEKWSLEFFRRRFGKEPVVFQNGRSPNDHRDSFVDHSVEASFSDFLDAIEQARLQNASPPYLIAHDRLLDRAAFKPLLDDVNFDGRYFDGQDTHGRVFFWLGAAGSTTPMHRDLGNVYMAQVMGHKLIRMVPSMQLHLMYNEFGYHSEADFNNLSLEDFPLLKHAHVMEFTLKPGDLLFIPVGWWHFVKSLDISVTITGNNFRFPNQIRPIFE